jgi:hypothetical protein
MEEGKAIAWVENKRELETNDRDRITAQIKKFAELYPVRAVHVNFTADAILATNFEILAVVRRYAPIGCEDLRDRLLARDFSVPSLDWINRKFDTLRKTGLLIRRPDRTYALTADALHRLGTRKNRHSPDIGRLLALARRGR